MSDSCPICGKSVKNYSHHRCSKKVLDAIDAARKRDYNNSENNKPFWVRLHDGFERLRQSDDSYDIQGKEGFTED